MWGRRRHLEPRGAAEGSSRHHPIYLQHPQQHLDPPTAAPVGRDPSVVNVSGSASRLQQHNRSTSTYTTPVRETEREQSPQIQLSARQMELLARRIHVESRQRPDAPEDAAPAERSRHDPPVVGAAPIRTPIPVSRSSGSTGSSSHLHYNSSNSNLSVMSSSNASSSNNNKHQRTLLRNLLKSKVAASQKPKMSRSSYWNGKAATPTEVSSLEVPPSASSMSTSASTSQPLAEQMRERLQRAERHQKLAAAAHRSAERFKQQQHDMQQRKEREQQVTQEREQQERDREQLVREREQQLLQQQHQQREREQQLLQQLHQQREREQHHRQQQPEASRLNVPTSYQHQAKRSVQPATNSDIFDEGYQFFLQVLQTEVSGQHSQLWESFSAVLQNRPAKLRSSPPEKKNKPYKFDAPTKQLLLEMNLQLKHADTTVECIGTTQLVNDKKYYAGIQLQQQRTMQEEVHSERTGSSLGSLASDSISRNSSSAHMTASAASSRSMPVSTHSPLAYSATMDSRNSSNVSDKERYTAQQRLAYQGNEDDDISIPQVRRYNIEDTVIPQPPYNVQTQRQATRVQDPILRNRSHSPDTTRLQSSNADFILRNRSTSPQPGQLMRHRNMAALADDGTVDDEDHKTVGETPKSVCAISDFETKSNPGLEITLGQFESKNSVPWKSMQLKRVQSSGGSVSSNSSVSPAFAQVRLRKVDAKLDWKTSMTMQTESSDEDDTSKSLSTAMSSFVLQQSESSGSNRYGDIPSAGSLSKSSIKTTSSVSLPPPPESVTSTTVSSSSTLIPSITSNETATLGEKQKLSPPKEHVDVIIPLATLNDDESWVIVGKHNITVRSEESVTWELPRPQIHSLSLEMATLQVHLLLLKQSTADDKKYIKTLSFRSSEDCLRFANAFYEMSDSGSSSSFVQAEGKVPAVVSGKEDDTSETEVSLLEALNDEEQKVLETYRRLRKTTSAEEAFIKSMPAQPEPVLLIDAEQEMAEKYSGMLRMNFPLAVVKEKMARDGLDPKTMDKILADAAGAVTPPQFLAGLPSSPVSTFSSSCALSIAEQETVASYRKMLRLNIPVDAVKHKMQKDAVDPKIVACVLGGDDAVSTKEQEQSALTTEEENLASGYRKMLKLSFPAEVVRHKMKRDQVSEKVMQAVLGGAEELPQPQETSDRTTTTMQLSGDEQALVAKYQKMLSLGVEKEGVEHKMKKDNVAQKIIDAVLGPTKQEAPALEKPPPRPALTNSALSSDEESVATQYRKLIKLQIPKDSVLTRMKSEGVSDKVINAVIGKSLEPPKPSNNNADAKDSGNSGSNLVTLHWTPISGKELDESIWSKASIKRDIATSELAGPAGSDITKLINLFQKKNKHAAGRQKRKDDSSNGSEKAKLLDLTRSNNVAISLKAFKKFSHQELANIINFLDPLRKVQGERVQFLRGLLPTINEIKVIKEYDGPDSRLVPAEIWFRQIANIERIDTKVQVLRTMEMFKGEAEMLMESFRLLTQVCKQVVQSDKLKDLLEMVLSIGNIMNEGTRTGGASGFKFDSLLRLTQTKSADGKTTVLDFLVTVFVAKGQRETLALSSDFPECHTASRMVVSDLIKEVKELGEALDQCKAELDALIADKASLLPVQPETDSSDPRSALLTAIKGRGTGRPAKSQGFALRDKFLSAVDENQDISSGPSKDNNYDVSKVTSDPVKDDGVEAGISRLRSFITLQTETFTILMQHREQALEACRETAKYCGESGGVGSTTPLLGVLAQFATNIDQALVKYDRQQEAVNRSKKQQKDKGHLGASTSNTAASVASGTTEAKEKKESLVLLVNKMLQEANERTKDDFKKGRFYENPSNTMQEIYVREKNIKKLDIVSSIREREEKVNTEELLEARSKFGRVSPSSPRKPTSDERTEGGEGFCAPKKQLLGENIVPARPFPDSERPSTREPPCPERLRTNPKAAAHRWEMTDHSLSKVGTTLPLSLEEDSSAVTSSDGDSQSQLCLATPRSSALFAGKGAAQPTKVADSLAIPEVDTYIPAKDDDTTEAEQEKSPKIPSVADAIQKLKNSKPVAPTLVLPALQNKSTPRSSPARVFPGRVDIDERNQPTAGSGNFNNQGISAALSLSKSQSVRPSPASANAETIGKSDNDKPANRFSIERLSQGSPSIPLFQKAEPLPVVAASPGSGKDIMAPSGSLNSMQKQIPAFRKTSPAAVAAAIISDGEKVHVSSSPAIGTVSTLRKISPATTVVKSSDNVKDVACEAIETQGQNMSIVQALKDRESPQPTASANHDATPIPEIHASSSPAIDTVFLLRKTWTATTGVKSSENVQPSSCKATGTHEQQIFTVPTVVQPWKNRNKTLASPLSIESANAETTPKLSTVKVRPTIPLPPPSKRTTLTGDENINVSYTSPVIGKPTSNSTPNHIATQIYNSEIDQPLFVRNEQNMAVIDISRSAQRLKVDGVGSVDRKQPSVTETMNEAQTIGSAAFNRCSDISKSLALIEKEATRSSAGAELQENSLLIELARKYSIEKNRPRSNSKDRQKDTGGYFTEDQVLKSAKSHLPPPTPTQVDVKEAAREGESAVLRLARLKRQEKALKARTAADSIVTKTASTSTEGTVEAPATPSPSRRETAMTRRARQLRSERRNGN